jgi:outer membrane biosynthesis protein TonB
MPVVGPRFLIEAAFLVAVAVGAGFARLGTITIILVMAAAWLLMAAVEWLIARAKVRSGALEPMAAPAEPLEQTRQPPAVLTVSPAPSPVPLPYPAATAPTAERSEPEPAPAPEREVTPGPTTEPAPEPEPEAPVEPVPAEVPPQQPRVPAVAAVPAPTPEPPRLPEPVMPEPEPRVVAFTPRSLGVPRQWNLWELERIAREQSGTDAERDEERSFLLMYLREFADADGVLPTSFDSIVRESFGDVLDAVGA